MATIVNVVRWADNTAELQRNLAEGLDQIEAVTKSADRLARRLNTDSISAAHKWAAAVDKIGGVTKLTTAEKARMNASLKEAIEKYTSLGKAAPTALMRLEEATRKAETATGTESGGGLAGRLSGLHKLLLTLGVAKVVNDTVRAAGGLNDLALASGMTTYELGRLQAAGRPVGVSVNTIAGAAIKLQNELGKGADGVVGAISQLGLNFDELRKMGPAQLFETVASAIANVEDPILRAHLKTQTFGRGSTELMALLRTDIRKVADEADRAGQIMDDSMIAALDDASDSFDELKQSVSVILATALQPLAMILGPIANGLLWVKTNAALALGPLIAFADWKKRVGEITSLFGTTDLPKAPGAPTSLLPSTLTNPKTPGADYMKQLDRELAASTRRLDEHAEAAKRVEDAYQAWRAQTTGAALQADVANLTSNLSRLTREGRLNETAIRNIAKEALLLRDRGATLSPLLEELSGRTRSWGDGLPKVQTGLKGITDHLPNLIGRLNSYALGIRGIVGSVGGLDDIMKNLPGQKVELGTPTGTSTSFTDFFQKDMAALVTGAFKGGGDIAKTLFSGIGSFLGSSGEAGSQIGNKLAGFFTKHLGANLGKFASSLLPGVGALLGPLASKIGGFIGGLFGKSKGAILDEQATEQIRKLQAELLTTHGSLDNIRRLGQMVGVDLAGAWGDKSQAGLKNFTALLDEFNAKQERLQSALKQYGLTWLDVGEQARQAHLDQTADNLIADFEILKTAGVDVTKIVGGMSGAINTFLTNALTTGAAIPPAMQPMIEQLIRAGKLTEENAALLLGMQAEAVPAWADIQAAAERYGITLDALGPKVQQIRINEQAAQIVKDWEFLIGAGANAGAVMAGMADEVQGLVTSALRFGNTLPEAMRPLIEQMIQAGLLTDLTGEKLTDVSKLNFAEPLAASVDRLIEALDKLIASLNGEVNRALDHVARDRDFVVRGHVEFKDPQTQVPGGAGGVDHAHTGAMVTTAGIERFHQGTAKILRFHQGVAGLRSDEVPAILQVGESVLNRQATATLGEDAIGALNRGRVLPMRREGDDLSGLAAALAQANGRPIQITLINKIGDQVLDEKIFTVTDRNLQAGRHQVPQQAISRRTR